MNSAMAVLLILSLATNVVLFYHLKLYKGIKMGGDMEVVNTADGRKIVSLDLDDDPETFEHAKQVLFRVSVLENDV